MTKPVLLSEIIGFMEIQPNDGGAHLNKKTGEILIFTDDAIRAVEDDEPDEFISGPEEELEEVRQYLQNEQDYVSLPSKFDIHEYAIMESFCETLQDGRMANDLYRCLKGRGAFRRFKDAVCRFGVEQQWYNHRDEALKEIAIDWCEAEGIVFADDTKKTSP